MWLVLGEKVKTRPVDGGKRVERECTMCGETAPFVEEEALEGDVKRVMACGACGEQFEVVDDRDEAPARPEVVKAEIVKAAPSAVAAPMPPSGGGKPAGLLSRVGRLFRSKVEHAVDQATDPAKVIEQLVVEMEDEIRRGRDETRKMMATQKLAAARTRNLEKSVADWTARAEVAVRAGDDALAKEALTRRTIAEGELADSRREQREAAGYAERMREGLRKNEAKLREIKLRKGTIKAKLAGARTAEVRAAALDEFERMAGKIDENESNVEAEAELIREDEDAKAASAATEAKFAKLERAGGPGSDLDARLAELKRKMGK